jgi:predicted deacetylase
MRRLLASIHDVSPQFEREVDWLLDLLRPHVGDRIALFVVPDHWGDAPIRPGSPFAHRLRGWADAGLELFLHGYFHRDTAAHDRLADRLRARWMTAGEGEFLGLGRDDARGRIERGLALIEAIAGRPAAGFVAPAWLYGRGVADALRDCGVVLAEDHFRIWSPAGGRVLSRSPVITWAARTPARRRSSLAAAAVLRRVPVRDLRIGVHPGDCHSPRLVHSIETTLRVAARHRRPAAYAELLD